MPEPKPHHDLKDAIIVGSGTTLSRSKLWELQLAAYIQFGPNAWFGKQVPFYITSNPLIAQQYAQVVIGYLRDCLAKTTISPINLAEPLYILDLGAGTGRFGFLFLKSLMEMLGFLYGKEIKICYVMTDVVTTNIEFWKVHPYLQYFIQNGLLDFCYYYHGQTENELHLIHSGRTLSKETVKNPMVILGNYFFDTIPHDIFRVKDKVLEEGQVTLSMERTEETEKLALDDPAVIPHLKYTINYVPVDPKTPYYPKDEEASRVLQSYAARYENIPFLFPVGAFQVIKFFREMSHENMLLLTGDQGSSTEDQLEQDLPFFAKHSSFSISVNYHAISTYFKQMGGTSFLSTYTDSMFLSIAASPKGGSEYFRELNGAFRLSLGYFDACDYLHIVNYTEHEWKTPNLEFILKLIKLGNWDPINFHLLFKHIEEKLPKASDSAKEQLVVTIHEIWKNFYPINKGEGPFVMNLGVLLFRLKQYDDAILFFNRALEMGYNDPLVYKNLAAAYTQKKDYKTAQEYLEKAETLRTQS
jgi:tetratricopeptide (TPR) repeat protein